MIPGEYLFDGPPLELNAGRPTVTLQVNNTGDRPVQVGSHFHFFEVNRAVVFDRAAAYGMRLDLPAGTAVRIEPGEVKTVQLVPPPVTEPPLDLVITNAVVLDHWGIVKGDIGVRGGRIIGVGKAGNPLIQPGVDPKLVIGPGTEVIAGENLIVTAGGIDSHVHFICAQLIETAIASGLTTLIGGGTGPATGTNATTCTPGAWNVQRMLQAAEGFPI